MPLLQLSKIQKRDHARILRGALPPEIQERLAERATAERRALELAAADTARTVEEMAKAQAEIARLQAEEYKRTLPDRVKAEQQKRFLKNAEKLS